ncbi:hypothetical protein V8G54_032810 [Vigna mungo]|uniref:Cation/H+ exchanger domain-containing protein n=1 Tax=Vigna mungo TaxID=3915 RepID=A0AAQ3MM69_VIGMU
MEVGQENFIRSTISVATNSLGEPFICHSTANQINSKGIWFGDDPLSYSLPIFLLQLFLMFIFTHFFYIILKPFGQPAVVSQILGGMTLGPSILGHSATFSEKVFPLKERSVLDTVTFFGFMLFIFLSGVKIDPTITFRLGRRNCVIGIAGYFVPYILAKVVFYILNHSASFDSDSYRMLYVVIEIQCISAFPVITRFLSELQILNSEIGRLAASSSLVAEACFIVNMALTFFIKLSLTKSVVVSIGSFLSSIVLFLFIIYVVHPAALWAIQQSPEGKPVEEIYICAVLVTLMICGLLGETIGISALVVSFFIGLAIPDGALLPLLYLRMPIRDAFALGFIMNIKGTVEMALLITLKLKDMVNDECFTLMVLNLLFVSGIVSPIVKSLYDPSRRFLAYKRRTLMHHNNDEQLRILACIHKQENVLGILNLLSASNPTKESPIDLVVLQLIKLVGRSSSVLVAHVPCKKFGELPTLSDQIFNSFDKFEDAYKGKITIHSYKGISPYATMHNDVCYLALEKRTTFIILPFHKRWIFGRTTESSFPFQQINKHVLEKAPCSVGVLIDRGNQKMFWCGHTKESTYHVAVFFFGGADDRETLAYAKRMLDQPYVYITLFLFSSSTDIVGGTETSKMLDTEILSEFRLKAFRNERVSFKDEMITSGRDLLSVVEYMESCYDLVLVGRKHGDSKIMSELNKWKNGELGVVGEILVSLNVGAQTSILVVQQQTRYWGSRNLEDSIRKAGIILGPIILGRHRSCYEALFPMEGHMTLSTFAEFGMMVHFFKMGVQIDPKQILKIKKQAIVIGVVGHVSSLACSGVILNIFRSIYPEETKDPSVLVLLISSSVTAFPVVTSFLTEMNIINSEVGRIAVSTSLVSDSFMWVFYFVVIRGQAPFVVAFCFGLILPDGPPLGSLLTEKLDIVGSTLIVPSYCTIVALKTSPRSLAEFKSLTIELILLAMYVGKFLGTIFSSLLFQIDFSDSFALSLIMCCKGLTDLSILNLLLNMKAIEEKTFTLGIFTMVIVTGSASLCVYHMYDPSKKYGSYIKKTIRNSQPEPDLKILACVHHEENVYPIVNLLQAANPREDTPLSVFVLHLVELSGSVIPILTEDNIANKSSQHIHNVFDQFHMHNIGSVNLHFFTAKTPLVSMPYDVCNLAMQFTSNIVIMPFHKWYTKDNIEYLNASIRTLNQHVLKKAPCSVGIFADRGHINDKGFVLYEKLICEIAMIYLGGGDDQEALSFSLRIAQHPNVRLTVFWFRVKTQSKQRKTKNPYIDLREHIRYSSYLEGKVTFKEEVVEDGADTTKAILRIEKLFSLIIVGKHHVKDSPCTLGLTEWCELPELGPLGNLLATSDFTCSFFVVQEQPRWF